MNGAVIQYLPSRLGLRVQLVDMAHIITDARASDALVYLETLSKGKCAWILCSVAD